ncbi:MAG: hypothetical protein FWG10_12880 [Eubacteriaceae bacterium]|nr:hypothetical protein [Eubacteriaceae bacterium]
MGKNSKSENTSSWAIHKQRCPKCGCYTCDSASYFIAPIGRVSGETNTSSQGCPEMEFTRGILAEVRTLDFDGIGNAQKLDGHRKIIGCQQLS